MNVTNITLSPSSLPPPPLRPNFCLRRQRAVPAAHPRRAVRRRVAALLAHLSSPPAPPSSSAAVLRIGGNSADSSSPTSRRAAARRRRSSATSSRTTPRAGTRPTSAPSTSTSAQPRSALLGVISSAILHQHAANTPLSAVEIGNADALRALHAGGAEGEAAAATSRTITARTSTTIRRTCPTAAGLRAWKARLQGGTYCSLRTSRRAAPQARHQLLALPRPLRRAMHAAYHRYLASHCGGEHDHRPLMADAATIGQLEKLTPWLSRRALGLIEFWIGEGNQLLFDAHARRLVQSCRRRCEGDFLARTHVFGVPHESDVISRRPGVERGRTHPSLENGVADAARVARWMSAFTDSPPSILDGWRAPLPSSDRSSAGLQIHARRLRASSICPSICCPVNGTGCDPGPAAERVLLQQHRDALRPSFSTAARRPASSIASTARSPSPTVRRRRRARHPQGDARAWRRESTRATGGLVDVSVLGAAERRLDGHAIATWARSSSGCSAPSVGREWDDEIRVGQQALRSSRLLLSSAALASAYRVDLAGEASGVGECGV